MVAAIRKPGDLNAPYGIPVRAQRHGKLLAVGFQQRVSGEWQAAAEETTCAST
jgi:hypothetical protein